MQYKVGDKVQVRHSVRPLLGGPTRVEWRDGLVKYLDDYVITISFADGDREYPLQGGPVIRHTPAETVGEAP